MGIAGQTAAFIAAQSQYEAIFQDVWNSRNDVFLSDQAVRTVQVDAKALVLPIVTGFPRFRQWLGSKHFKDLRAYAQSVSMTTYERSIEVDRLDVELDPTGTIDGTIRGFLGEQKNYVEDTLITAVLANTWLGYDGVALLSDSHPHTNSTGDNLVTTAFSATAWNAAIVAMGSFQDEEGTPMRVRPNVVIVGPDQERVMKDVLGTERVVAVNTSGAEDATSSVIAAVTRSNIYAGEAVGIVSPWITGNQWLAMDLSKPGLMPFLRALHTEAHPTMLGPGQETETRFLKDKYLYSVEGDWTYAPGLWQLVYGSVSA